MKLVRKLAIAAVILGMIGGAQADALYWQVDTAAGDASYKGEWTHAALFASDGTTTGSQVGDYYKADANGRLAPTLSDLRDYGSSSYSFYVELYNVSLDAAAYKTGLVSYDQLAQSGYISTGNVALPRYASTSGFNGASVPEPTGGVLMLIGGALLALRWRRD